MNPDVVGLWEDHPCYRSRLLRWYWVASQCWPRCPPSQTLSIADLHDEVWGTPSNLAV